MAGDVVAFYKGSMTVNIIGSFILDGRLDVLPIKTGRG